MWDGIEAGCDDLNVKETLNEYYQEQIVDLYFLINATFLAETSPSLPIHMPIAVARKTFSFELHDRQC